MGRRASQSWQLSPVRQASSHAAPLRDLRGKAQGQERGMGEKASRKQIEIVVDTLYPR